MRPKQKKERSRDKDRHDDRDRDRDRSKRARSPEDRSERSSKRRRSEYSEKENSHSERSSDKKEVKTTTKKQEEIKKRLTAWKQKIKPELSSLFADDEPTKKKLGFLEISIQDRKDLLELPPANEPAEEEKLETIDKMDILEITNENEEEKELKEALRAEKEKAEKAKRNERIKERLLELEKEENFSALSGKNEEKEFEGDPLEAYMAEISQKAKEAREKSINKAKKESEKNKKIELEEDEPDDEEMDPVVSALPKRLQRKILEEVDHSKIDYLPFRKNFYIEVPEIAKLTEDDAVQMRIEMENIQIRGQNCPKPIRSFTQCGLSNKVLSVLSKYDYDTPTPIQAQAIPAVMNGRDVIGIAKTGSGKTLAYLLPMFRHILDQPPLANGDGPIGLIMAPTRELATQIHHECKKFKKATGLRSVCVYGGAGVQHQIGDLKRGAEIVVCTPGRMIDILCANRGRITNLRRVTMLVLDEADRMFDMGFEPQISRIINNIQPDRQTLLFSATFPKAVEGAVRKILTNPLELTVQGKGVVSDTVDQNIEIVEENQKLEKLMELISEWYDKGSVLVFVDRQESADQLLKKIQDSGYHCLSLHGGKDQLDRDFTIKDFKEGKIKILVATSIAARGLDVSHLRLVINYDVPNHLEDYVHRVGRTGRAGNKGTAWTLITPDESQYARDVYFAMKNSGAQIPEKLQKMVDEFEEKRKQGLVQKRKSGFTRGTGYKFDENEELEKIQAMKLKRMAYGVITEEDDEDEIEELKNKILENKEKKSIKAEGSGEGDAPDNPSMKATKDMLKQTDPEGFSLQAEALTQIQASTDHVPIASTRKERMILAKKHIEAISNKPASGSLINNTIKMRFTEELEINDYPQAARWKVTHKDALASITEFTGCGVTAKGLYCAPGRNPAPGQRKLYLFIEGNSLDEVKRAKIEIKRILDDAVLTAHPDKAGRYTVV